jgi:hypothetical protein
VILESLDGVTAADFAARTDWQLNPEGLCRGEFCVPAPGSLRADETIDISVIAASLGMPLVHDQAHGVYALGPATATGRALSTVTAADPQLITRHGEPFRLSSLRGRKVVMVAWASY